MRTLSKKTALVAQKAQSFRSQEHLLSRISLSRIINNPAVQPCPQKYKANQHHSGPLPIPPTASPAPFHIFNFQRLPISHYPILEIAPFLPISPLEESFLVGRKMQEENKLAMLMVGGDGGESSGGGLAAVAVEELGQLKAEIVAHPMFDQLLAAHVACLRVATPVDQLPVIDDQLSESGRVLRSYESLHQESGHVLSAQKSQELDGFLTQYVLVLCSFKELLQNHVKVHAVEAVLACREIEHNLQNLTGATLGEGTEATMSDDEDDPISLDYSLDQSAAGGADINDMMGFGPLLPTESERSLMERVRHELKLELKQGFKSRIEDVREEILRKRRAGKLPGDTTSILKTWWQQHSKWPYPTEDDKAKLVEETGLQLKQINNWFINQRKRNWHNNSHSANTLKSKRKS